MKPPVLGNQPPFHGQLPVHSGPTLGGNRPPFDGHLPVHSGPVLGRPQPPSQGHDKPVHQPSGGWNFGGDRKRDGDQLFRQDRDRFHVQVKNPYVVQSRSWGDHWRYGYTDPRGSNSSFHFAFYLNSPFESECYVSPFYYYSNLPAYVPAESVTVVNDYSFDWNCGVPYRYEPGNSPDKALNRSIDDLFSAFENQNSDAIYDLIAYNGHIGVFTEGRYDYTLSVEDFHDMMLDNVQATETVSFRVDQMRKSGDQVVLNCTHVVRDGDGGTVTVYQQYHLRNNNGRYIISDFMTSHSPMD